MSHAQVGTLGKEIGNCEWFWPRIPYFTFPKPWAGFVYYGSFGASFLLRVAPLVEIKSEWCITICHCIF